MRALYRRSDPLICGCIDPSGFQPSSLTVIEGTSMFVRDAVFNLCARIACNGRDVIVVDGANSFNPYAISRTVKFMGFNPRHILSHIHIARAFTEYQMDAIISGLHDAAAVWKPGFVAVMYLSNLFSTHDGKKLFGPILNSLKDTTRSLSLSTAVTSFGGIWWGDRMVAANADRVIKIKETKTIIKVQDGNTLFEYVPLPPGQTRFNDFIRGDADGQNRSQLQDAS